MEEMVGVRWHRLITRLASDGHEQAVVTLAAEQSRLAIVFRALGGDPGLRVVPATERAVRARRHWLKRIAGTGRRHALAWRDSESVRLPARIGLFADASLNRELYLWLIVMASRGRPLTLADWFTTNQRLAAEVLAALPGLQPLYRRLVAAVLCQRRNPEDLPPAESRRELAIQDALRHPGCRDRLPAAPGEPVPVPLWLYPAPDLGTTVPAAAEACDQDEEAAARVVRPARSARARKSGEYVEDIDGRNGLIAFRLESLFS
ncbi:MAG TPA: nitric oxide reductase, partial [Nitrococcus sp.]|nr:nitric oxide reductase [Nitrococcus sp.]